MTRAARAWSSALVCAACGCGYQPVYRTTPVKLHVVLVGSLAPDAVAADEVVSGAREELARAGALQSGDGFPRVEIEVLRADDASEGVVARANAPVARATNVSVLARAWIAPAADSPHVSDTGDMRAEESITIDATPSGTDDPRADLFHRADARRAAARRLGRKLAARVLGQPSAVEDTQ